MLLATFLAYQYTVFFAIAMCKVQYLNEVSFLQISVSIKGHIVDDQTFLQSIKREEKT